MTQWIGNFAARCVADDCLAPKFLQESSHEPDSLSDKAHESLAHAMALIKMPHGMVRLDNVWGTGGGKIEAENKQKYIAKMDNDREFLQHIREYFLMYAFFFSLFNVCVFVGSRCAIKQV